MIHEDHGRNRCQITWYEFTVIEDFILSKLVYGLLQHLITLMKL